MLKVYYFVIWRGRYCLKFPTHKLSVYSTSSFLSWLFFLLFALNSRLFVIVHLFITNSSHVYCVEDEETDDDCVVPIPMLLEYE